MVVVVKVVVVAVAVCSGGDEEEVVVVDVGGPWRWYVMVGEAGGGFSMFVGRCS